MPHPQLIFEHISRRHYLLLRFAAWMRWDIRIFDFSHVMEQKIPGFARALISAGKIQRILPLTGHPEAISRTVELFPALPISNFRNILSLLYKNADSDLLIQRVLVDDVYKVEFITNYLRLNAASLRIIFVQNRFSMMRNFFRKSGTDFFHLPKNVSLIRIFSWPTSCAEILARVMWVFIGVFMVLCPAGLIPREKSNAKSVFRFAFSLNTWLKIKFEGKRGMDFLLNGRNINRKNSVFILSGGTFNHMSVDAKQWIAQKQEQGFHFQYDLFDRTFRSLLRIIRFTSTTVPARCALMLLQSVNVPSNLLKVFSKSCEQGARWHRILSEISFEKYVYSNQEGWDQIARNLIFAKSGISTWMYSSFIGGGLLYARSSAAEALRKKCNILWSFMNGDNFLAVNEDVIRYYKLHHQKIGRYIAIGNLYSQLVQEYMDEIPRTTWLQKHFHDIDRKTIVVSFFDTSFVDSSESPTSYDDGICAYEDIRDLLEKHRDMRLIIKPSKSEAFFLRGHWSSPEKGSRLLNIWENLRNHPRVYWAGDSGDLPLIMAMSDIIITHCMSSPTVEALGAKKKAFWYESGLKHEGLIYDQIPGLVVHGRSELEKRFRILKRQSKQAYDQYLKKNIKSSLEAYMDGKGIRRFQNLLAKN